MFERFSEAARVALFGARFEVSKSGDTSIEPAHLLMGLLHAKGGIAARLAQDAGLDADDVRPRLLSRATVPLATHIEVPFGPATKKVLSTGAQVEIVVERAM